MHGSRRRDTSPRHPSPRPTNQTASPGAFRLTCRQFIRQNTGAKRSITRLRPGQPTGRGFSFDYRSAFSIINGPEKQSTSFPENDDFAPVPAAGAFRLTPPLVFGLNRRREELDSRPRK
jgi:hypothetical protein